MARKITIARIVAFATILAIWLVIFAIPFGKLVEITTSIQISPEVSKYLAITSIAVLLLTLGMVTFRRGISTLSIIGLLSVAFATLLHAIRLSDPTHIWRFIIVVLPLSIGLSIGILIEREAYQKLFWNIGYCLAAVSLFVSIHQAIFDGEGVTSGSLRRFGGLTGHPAAIYPTVTVLAILSLSEWIRSNNILNWTTALAFVLNLLAVLLTGYRSAALAILFFLVLYVIVFRPTWRVALIPSILCISVATTIFFERGSDSRSAIASEQSVDGRIQSSKVALSSIGEWWLAGKGPGQFSGVAKTHRYGVEADVYFNKAGNEYLHLFVEWGALGLIWMVFTIIQTCKEARISQKATVRQRPEYHAFGAFLFLFLFDVIALHPYHAGATTLLGIIIAKTLM